MTEKRTREFKPADTSNYSFRDQLRELMRLKYGMRGKRFAESLLGESEEEKYMKYLIRNYGYTPSPETQLPESRPMRDMLNVQGGGPSDLGALDVVLMGLSGAGKRVLSPMAAGTETAMLGGDAYGEYKKGNPGTAALMLGAAGLPPLLAYKFRPTRADQELKTELQRTTPSPGETDTPMDPSRRKALEIMGTGILGLAASKLAPDMTALSKVPTTGLAKLTPSIGNFPTTQLVESEMLSINSPLLHKVLYNTSKDMNFDVGPLEYEASNAVYQIGKLSEKFGGDDKIPLAEFNKALEEVAKEESSRHYDWAQEEVYEIMTSDSFKKHLLQSIEDAKSYLRQDPQSVKALERAGRAEKAVMDNVPGGFSADEATRNDPRYKKYFDEYYDASEYNEDVLEYREYTDEAYGLDEMHEIKKKYDGYHPEESPAVKAARDKGLF
tara:strand:+ start:63 stop:1382 length:1320 start_codon:yes stop_codon:yes gene_type:complete